MALPASDVFTTGSNQAIATYSANWTVNAGAMLVLAATDDVRGDSSGAECAAHWDADAFDDDQYSEATVTALTADGSGASVGVAVRCAASGATYYGLYHDPQYGLFLFKSVAGVWTQIGSEGATSAVQVGDVLRLEVEGTTLRPYINGVLATTPGAQTDSSISSGSAGICAYSNLNNRIDNWEGGNLTAASIEGELAVTLADATLAATGEVSIEGSAAVTLEDATVSATGVVGSENSGTLAATLDDATLAATGTLPIDGALAATLADATLSATGTLTIEATATVTLADATVNARGYILTGVCVDGVLTVSANGRYFANADGPIVLAGMHTWYNIQDGGTTDPPDAFDWDEFLTSLISYGHNITKLWRLESPQDWANFPDEYMRPMAYPRTGGTNAADGKPRFDLDSWDETYFTRLRERAIEAGNAGIYVIAQLFQGWQIEDKDFATGDPWAYHPFNSANNTNSVNGDPGADGKGLELRDTAQTALYNRSLAFVDKMISTLGDLDHVIWEVSNEDGYTTTALTWQRAIAAYLKAEDARNHPVGITKLWPNGNDAALFASDDADWISPDDDYPVPDPDASDGSKVILYDTDHVFGVGTEYNWVMQAFAMGNSLLYMDIWDGALYGNDTRADADYILIRRLMGDAAAYAQRMDLLNATPQPSLSTTGWCLAKTTGDAHLFVYQDDTGAFDVDLTGISGTFELEWYRVSDGTTQAGSPVTGGAERTLTPPWSGEVAAFLTQGNAGTLSVTLDDTTLTSAGVVALTGALTVTLGNATVAATGVVAIVAVASVALDDATLVASGELVVEGSGTLNVTLDDATLAAAGTLPIVGTLAVTLDDATVESAATLALTGALSATLDDATVAATGVAGDIITGELGVTLDDAALVAAATVALQAAVAVTLDDASLSGTGTLSIAAQAVIALSPATLSSIGTVVILGAATIQLADATLTATGGEVVPEIPTIAAIVYGPAASGVIYGPRATATLGG